ncbi:MAG: hypothetical protein VYA88_03170, partial [Actinomycetota bacterium]|nr:hypothetical protein [Actinomycetota bacterium]
SVTFCEDACDVEKNCFHHLWRIAYFEVSGNSYRLAIEELVNCQLTALVGFSATLKRWMQQLNS